MTTPQADEAIDLDSYRLGLGCSIRTIERVRNAIADRPDCVADCVADAVSAEIRPVVAGIVIETLDGLLRGLRHISASAGGKPGTHLTPTASTDSY